MRHKKISALVLSLLLVMSLGTTAFAANSTTAVVPVTLTVANEYRAVNVTIPASLPVYVINGTVVVADSAAITNNSKTTAIKVTSVQVTDGAYRIGNYEDPVGIVCNEEAKLEGLPLNRALRDEDGDIYDIVAGTFAVVGLTDDSFGSLEGDLALKYAKLFEQPEQFAKLGDKIVAIPMISEEQQKHQAAEQKDFEVNMDTHGLVVSGHIGTWHTIDHKEVDGHTFWLMEHDHYGDGAGCIVVDEKGKLSLDNVYDGFDDHTVDLLHQSLMPVERMPDDSISIDEMQDYGYSWAGMLPMREEAAAEVMKSCTIYRLYGDDTEGMVMTAADIKPHADKGGIFGVEKVDWIAALERQNPLKAAEMTTEDDYGMIDGIINNGPKEDKSAEKSGKSSIMDRLKAAKSEPPKEKVAPQKERKPDRDL